MNNSLDECRKEECGQTKGILKGRTKVACEFCRRRKIKCNGAKPCSNCVNGGKENCTYPNRVEEKKTSTKYVSSAKTVQLLSKRMASIESVLAKIASKFEETKNEGVGNGEGKEEEMNKRFGVSNGRRLEENWSWSSETSSVGVGNETRRSSRTEAAKSTLAQCFKSYSIFCIFSKASISWMEQALGNKDEELVTLIRNMPMVFGYVLDSLTQMWLNANQGHQISHTPIPDSPVVFQLLEAYYENIHLAAYICDLSYIREIFVRYYNQNFEGCDKLKFSELLIMNVSLALCLIDVHNDKDVSLEGIGIESFSEGHLFDLKTMLFNNAIFFYDKILVINEGIESIQAIFLLVLYMELSHISDFQIIYMLSSVAIRYAQEMGLHRSESFQGCTEKETELRRRLWSFCHHSDIEYSYRCGKPPLINNSSVSTLTENDSYIFSVPIDPFMNTLSNDRIISECQVKGTQAYYGYFFLMLNRIRVRSYESLFSVKAQKEILYSKEKVLQTLQTINGDMFKMALMMEPEVRPTLHDDRRRDSPKNPNFQPLYDGECNIYKEHTLNLQLSFFSHLITINRIPFLIDSYENDSVGFSLGNLGLDAARRVLKIILPLDKTSSPTSFFNGLLLHTFLSFSCLVIHCLNFPTDSKTHNDCLLLIKVSRRFFSCKSNSLTEEWAERRKYDLKATAADFIARVLLRLVVNVVSFESGRNYVEEIDGLAEHFEQCKLIYPEFFNKEPNHILDENNQILKLTRFFDPLVYSFNDSYAKQNNDFAADFKSHSSTPNRPKTLNYRRSSLDDILNHSESCCGRP
ncbi:unnamed protein product [Debaryomyces tyrocola]|nr:unnamed protein product [Debaryomyces tyrocola]